jgi:hypothetical protein
MADVTRRKSGSGAKTNPETTVMKGDLPGPKFVQLFWPVLSALRTLGGSARPAEVVEQVGKDLKLPESERSELLESGTPKFTNLVAWARFYLGGTDVYKIRARITMDGSAIEVPAGLILHLLSTRLPPDPFLPGATL